MFKVNDLVKSKVTGVYFIVNNAIWGDAVHVRALDGMCTIILAKRLTLVGRNHRGKQHVKAK